MIQRLRYRVLLGNRPHKDTKRNIRTSTYSEKSITSSNIAKILDKNKIILKKKKVRLKVPIHENHGSMLLTTIFSAASHILSTLASDKPLIPVKFCTEKII